MISSDQIRARFLSYFSKNGHEILDSSPLVPQKDPTLMFINAGMVPFKNYFSFLEESEFSRIATSQKCVRAGGKHNDLANVGFTSRHHTFFEMLGNFSFGDYFKEEAIFYAWDFLTNDLKISKEKLLVTIYHTDEESFNLWKKISNLPDKKIIKISTDDNFWSMGDSGPCGPCSEIFYDHGEHIFGDVPGSKDEDGDRFVEIWNLVFMEFLKDINGDITSLPKKSIDTGMGLERITAVMQSVHDNYETDLFQDIVRDIESKI